MKARGEMAAVFPFGPLCVIAQATTLKPCEVPEVTIFGATGMPHIQVRSLANLRRLINDQEAQGICFQFRGWVVRLPDGSFAHGPDTAYGIIRRKLLVTHDRTEAERIALKDSGEAVELWTTPTVTLAIARKTDGALWWDATVQATG